MSLRRSAPVLKRMFSGIPRASAAEKLPFEKPIFESEILDRAMMERNKCKKIEYYGNVISVLVGVSVMARLGYYVVYGKEGGAAALPPRR